MITHPFHPLVGRRVEVLFSKRRGGVVVFVCEGGPCGRVTVPLEWTDRGVAPMGHRLWVEGLVALGELVDVLVGRCEATGGGGPL